MLLLDGTITLGKSLAHLMNLDDSGAPGAAGSGANSEGVNLLSCAAAVTCGGAGEPSTPDGTSHVSRLVPFTAADSKGEHHVQFEPK